MDYSLTIIKISLPFKESTRCLKKKPKVYFKCKTRDKVVTKIPNYLTLLLYIIHVVHNLYLFIFFSVCH